ncbi:MAG TPA: tetratricopeptide repeat protein [Rhabdochlamydiaceae bacterium]|jgi:tetratricopeptide (TPR) repeat protein
MKKKWIVLSGLLSLIGTLSAQDKVSSLQEGVELRRIAEYCKEKNFYAVKTHVNNFLTKFPHSDTKHALHAMLGDVYFAESDFSAALNEYNSIKKQELWIKTEFRRIHCLHQLKRYEELIDATLAFIRNEHASPQELPALRFQLGNALFQQSFAAEDQESKTKLLQFAKEQFKLIGQTEYQDQVLVPLALVHTCLKEYPQAVKIYTYLSEKDSKNKEEYLLQMLQLQLRYDKDGAIETCQKIYTLDGPAASQAAFNQLSLLFQEKRYRDLIHFQDKAIKYISKEHLPLAHYFIGRGLFHIGDNARAATHLNKYLSAQSEENHGRLKNALLTVLHCAKESENSELFEKTLSQIKEKFPKDPETAKATLLHAQLCKRQGKIHKAIENLQELLDDFSDLSQRDSILYDYAMLLAKEHKWMESASAFETFIKKFSSHPQCHTAWRHLIQCKQNCVHKATPDTLFVAREELGNTLNRALKEKAIFSAEERRTLRFIYARTLYEIQKYDRALGELAEYVKDYHDDHRVSEAYLLVSLCHYYGTQDLDLFTSYAEKALALQPNLPEAALLHVNLFNTYLSQTEKKHVHEKNEMLLKAADHLFQCLDHPMKKDNQLWLANFYFQNFKESQYPTTAFFLERSISVLEKILQFNPITAQLKIPDDAYEMEAEAIKLAELYNAKSKHMERITLLQSLIEEYKRHTEYAWKYQRLAHFELAMAYKENKQYDKALKVYSFLIDSSSHSPSYFATAAQLEKTLLEFSLLKADQKKETSKEMQDIFDALKDLEIKRKLFSEPCHLEAGLSYIDIIAGSPSTEQEIERKILLLSQLQENFSALDDPLVTQYLSTKEEFPEKHQLLQQYMQLIASDMMCLKAQLAKTRGEKEKSLEFSQQAQDQLVTLSSHTALHARLKERVEKSREALKQIL